MLFRSVFWRRQVSDGATHAVNVGGRQQIALSPSSPFTPYADLTEAQVIGWLEAALGEDQIAQIDASLGQLLENQVNPPIIELPLPWGA